MQLFDFSDPANNDWLVANQFTVTEDKNNRRPDIVVFVNGLPLGAFELKNLADENATIRDAFNQFQTATPRINRRRQPKPSLSKPSSYAKTGRPEWDGP